MQSAIPNFEKAAQQWQAQMSVYSTILYEDEALTQPVELSLFEDDIIIQASEHTRTIKTGFDVKFKLLRRETSNFAGQTKPVCEPYGIAFLIESETGGVTLYSPNPTDLLKLRQAFSPILVQTDFHSQYRAIRKIGKGNCATVYLGERLEDGRKLAVKAFSKENLTAEARGQQALHNEIQILRNLKHRNLLQLSEVFQTQNSIYLCAEWLQGGQLFTRALKQRFSLGRMQNVLRQLLEGLRELSRLGVIHRDLKPENIIFRHPDSDQLVICDFGLATYSNHPNYIYVRCGTPGYTAPEILRSKQPHGQSPISDMFSFGIIIYFLVFQRVPFKGSNLQEISLANRKCQFDFHPKMTERMDGDLLDLMMRCLEAEPGRRVTVEDALGHRFFTNRYGNEGSESTLPISPMSNESSIHQKTDLTRITDSLGTFVLGQAYRNKQQDPMTPSGAMSPFRALAQVTPQTADSPAASTQNAFSRMVAEKSEYFKDCETPRKKVHLDSSIKSKKVTISDLFQ